MRPEQAALIRTTWAQVTPLGIAAAALFYERLFALDPELAAKFAHTDMERQGKKLLQALTVLVATADRLHTLGPSLEELGRGHLWYGVMDRHYDTVGVRYWPPSKPPLAQRSRHRSRRHGPWPTPAWPPMCGPARGGRSGRPENRKSLSDGCLTPGLQASRLPGARRGVAHPP